MKTFAPRPKMQTSLDLNKVDIKKLVMNHEEFSEFVYTPLLEAVYELKKRWKDEKLERQVHDYLEGDIPGPLLNSFKAVLFRQLFTPNHELERFIETIDRVGIKPMFLEYYDDKFTTNNPLKHALGKMKFQKELGENPQNRICSKRIIEFNGSDGRKIKEVKTLWDQSLIDFHHELLESVFPNSKQYLFDASDWFHRGGNGAKEYYNRYIYLFLRNGILFENFILEGGELSFVENIFLPSFIDVWKKTGKKPLISALLPVDVANDSFWVCHPFEILSRLQTKNMI